MFLAVATSSVPHSKPTFVSYFSNVLAGLHSRLRQHLQSVQCLNALTEFFTAVDMHLPVPAAIEESPWSLPALEILEVL